MIGLGVGIDYALFLVTRHQDQLARRAWRCDESIAHAVATSGSAIVFAGGTVVIALLALAVAGIPLVTSLGYASAVAVVTAVLAAITLLPALLALLGHRHRLRSACPPSCARRRSRRARAVGRLGAASSPATRWSRSSLSVVVLVPLIDPGLLADSARRTSARRRRHHRAPGLRPDDRGLRRRLQRPAAGRRRRSGPAGDAEPGGTAAEVRPGERAEGRAGAGAEGGPGAAAALEQAGDA